MPVFIYAVVRAVLFLCTVLFSLAGCSTQSGWDPIVGVHALQTSSGDSFRFTVELPAETANADVLLRYSGSVVADMEVVGLGSCHGRELGGSLAASGSYGFSCTSVQGASHTYGFDISGAVDIDATITFRPA